MNMRDILKITNDHGLIDDTHRVIGEELVKLFVHINLAKIDPNDLASHVISTIRNSYLRRGESREQDLSAMYGKDQRFEDLEIAEMEAKVSKLESEANKIDRS